MRQEYVVTMIIDVDPLNRTGEREMRLGMKKMVVGTSIISAESWEIKKIKSIKRARP